VSPDTGPGADATDDSSATDGLPVFERPGVLLDPKADPGAAGLGALAEPAFTPISSATAAVVAARPTVILRMEDRFS